MERARVQNGPDEKAWFERWFDSSFYHKLYSYRNEEEATRFVNELTRELEPPAGAHMLDLGCGNGRHSKRLASKGFNVTGIDLAASSIREAKKGERPGLRFYRQDMRTAFGESAFDYVFSFFTSFGYFTDLRDDNRVMENVSKALKPGGTFVLDYLNPVFAEKKRKETEEKEIDGIVYSIRRRADEAWFFKKISLEDPLFGKPLEYTERVRKFSVADLVCLLSEHGLRLQKIFGDYNLNGYAEHASPRMILVAQKTGRQNVGGLSKNKHRAEH